MYRVKISWKIGQDTTAWWDKACAWVVEEFGLPGGRYKTEITEDHMVFDFNDRDDAMIMILRWGNDV